MAKQKEWSKDPRVVGSDARTTPSIPICKKITKDGTHVGYGFFTEEDVLIYDSRANPDNREDFPDPLNLKAHCELVKKALKEFNNARNRGFSK